MEGQGKADGKEPVPSATTQTTNSLVLLLNSIRSFLKAVPMALQYPEARGRWELWEKAVIGTVIVAVMVVAKSTVVPDPRVSDCCWLSLRPVPREMVSHSPDVAVMVVVVVVRGDCARSKVDNMPRGRITNYVMPGKVRRVEGAAGMANHATCFTPTHLLIICPPHPPLPCPFPSV